MAGDVGVAVAAEPDAESDVDVDAGAAAAADGDGFDAVPAVPHAASVRNTPTRASGASLEKRMSIVPRTCLH
jgi:hypothetical protein